MAKHEKGEFTIGDVVYLRSGGPAMTYVGPVPSKDGLVFCAFFDGSDALQSNEFMPEMLTTTRPEL